MERTYTKGSVPIKQNVIQDTVSFIWLIIAFNDVYVVLLKLQVYERSLKFSDSQIAAEYASLKILEGEWMNKVEINAII